MKMQVRFAIAVFTAVCFLSGCGSQTDAPVADELKPGEVKTKADMLVGKWKLVKRTPWMPADTIEREYKRDGKVVASYYNHHDGSRVIPGTYDVDGDTIFHDFNNEGGRRGAAIETLTADKLVISGVADDEMFTTEFERIQK